MFTSFPVVSYPRAFVTSDYATVTTSWETAPLPSPYTLDNYNPSGAWDPILDLQDQLTSFSYLDRASCVDRFISPLSENKSALVIVATNVTSSANEGYSLLHGAASDWGGVTWTRSSWWICDDYGPADLRDWKPCTSTLVDSLGLSENWVLPAVDRVPKPTVQMEVDYCLVGPVRNMDAKCGLHYGSQMFVAVTVCTLLESLLILSLWRQSLLTTKNKATGAIPDLTAVGTDGRNKTMVLMGDAIAEYLRHPGPMPKHVEMEEQLWNARSRVKWFATISKTAWAVTMFM